MIQRIKCLVLVIISMTFVLVSAQSYVGLRGAVSLNTLRDFQRNFFLDLMKELGSMKIPNQDFKFDLKVANLSMKLTL